MAGVYCDGDPNYSTIAKFKKGRESLKVIQGLEFITDEMIARVEVFIVQDHYIKMKWTMRVQSPNNTSRAFGRV